MMQSQREGRACGGGGVASLFNLIFLSPSFPLCFPSPLSLLHGLYYFFLNLCINIPSLTQIRTCSN